MKSGVLIIAFAAAFFAVHIFSPSPSFASTETRVSEFALYMNDGETRKNTSVFPHFLDARFDITLENNKTFPISGGLCFVWMWYGQAFYCDFEEATYAIMPGGKVYFRGLSVPKPRLLSAKIVELKKLNIARNWMGRDPDPKSDGWVFYLYADDNADGDYSDAIAIYNCTFTAGGFSAGA